ncbi:MAG TPA: DUF3108 domain-containing protein [Blastocatellia bacterium]|nr:DUF3108 domain-containing protein [Blastocatellia bacterium]
MYRKYLAQFVIVIQLAALAGAQTAPQQASATAAPKVARPLPFQIGEQLTYEVGFSKFIFSGQIGEINLSVAKAESAAKPGLLELRGEAVSKGFFPSLFGIKVKDRFVALVNPDDFGLHSSTKIIEEGKKRREQKAIIDREAGKLTYIDRDLANKDAEPKVKEADAPSWVQDILSTCYYVRTQELKEGAVIPVPLSDEGKVYNIEVIVGKREEVKVDAGKFRTVKLEAKVFNGKFVRRSGEMFIWVTDDARRIPVRAKIKTSGATVNISLKQVK